MCIGGPAKRGQTQNTTVGTAKKGGQLLPIVRSVAPIRFRMSEYIVLVPGPGHGRGRWCWLPRAPPVARSTMLDVDYGSCVSTLVCGIRVVGVLC